MDRKPLWGRLLSYPDLSQPITQVVAPVAATGSSTPKSPSDQGFLAQHPMVQNAINAVKSILPTPTLPLGLNVASGLLSSPLPQPYRNAMAQAPQIATGTNYGVPQQIASGIGNSLPALATGGPNIATQAISGFGMGAAQAPPGQRMEGGLTNALVTTLLGKVIPSAGKMAESIISPVTKNDFAQSVQGVHDAISNDASQGFQNVTQGVNDRGINQVPLTLSTMNDISNAVKSGYLPNKPQTTDLLNNASFGDFNALRDLRSELWKRATKASSSDSLIDNNKGDEMFDLMSRIDNHISNHLDNTGNTDLSSQLRDSMDKYKYLKDTFYNKNLPVGMKKLVNPEIRETPDNLGTLIQRDSIPMNNVRNAITKNPANNWLGNTASSLPRDIESYNTRNSLWPFLKGVGYGGFGIGEGLGLYKLLHGQPAHE